VDGISKVTVRRASGGPIEYFVVGQASQVEAKILAAMRAGKVGVSMTSARTGKPINIDLASAETYKVTKA
jgi:hypothetical protein